MRGEGYTLPLVMCRVSGPVDWPTMRFTNVYNPEHECVGSVIDLFEEGGEFVLLAALYRGLHETQLSWVLTQSAHRLLPGTWPSQRRMRPYFGLDVA